MPAGRPTKYTKILADKICSELAEGISLRTICLAEDMPDKSNVFKWLRTRKEFRDQYERAKEASADAMSEDILDIADDGTNDFMELQDKEGENIGWRINGEAVQRSKLRVDTRKWIASKLKPKKYGDKIDMTTGGKPFTISFHESLKQDVK
jgi:hypothetical protein